MSEDYPHPRSHTWVRGRRTPFDRSQFAMYVERLHKIVSKKRKKTSDALISKTVHH